MKHLRIKTKLFQRAALMMLTLFMALTSQTAWADDYGWYDGSITIDGNTTNVTNWSDHPDYPTDLGFVTDMTITSISFKVWSNANDRVGANIGFKVWDSDGTLVGTVSESDFWLGSATRITGDHDFSISWTGEKDLATSVGLNLEYGKIYYIDMWAKTYNGITGGDEWYHGVKRGDEWSNYHAKLTYVPATYTVTTHLAGGAYWSTFYSKGNYKAPDDTQVFAVKLNGTTLEMNPISDRIVKSEQGVVLKKTTTGDITMTKTNDEATFDFGTYNGLGGTMEGITTTSANNYYVLGGDTNGAGFYKLASGGAIGANKAYLTYTSSAREFFLFDDDATGIDMPMVESSEADAVVYDLQGRRVAQPTKGLYIVNGKKVIIK